MGRYGTGEAEGSGFAELTEAEKTSAIPRCSPGHLRRLMPKDAMRHAVTARRDAYRDRRFEDGTDVFCFLSGESLAEADLQVIYVDPAWEQLTFRFAEDEGG